MLELINILWSFIGAVIAMVILGLIAGFSPTLYATQVGLAAATKRSQPLMISLMIGVLIGIILLSIFFQFFQVETLRLIIDSTLKALYVSVVFNTILGTSFILGGFWYIHKKPNRITKDAKVNAKSGYWALISLGFFRTFVSISGATATFLASNLISESKEDIIERLVLTAIFLAAVIAPFALILIVMNRHPERMQDVLAWSKTQLKKINYKLIIGVTAILVGSSIIMFNVLKAITF
ncbi:MAG: hypothetical protein V4611_01615 [Patescibacteria group bacterium]